MEGYGTSTYGDLIADVYDGWHAYTDNTDAAVEHLAALASASAGPGRGSGPGGRALELAIGTGRIALPLAERGIEVHGIDSSRAMIAKLRRKPGGKRIPVIVGDFADVAVDGTFDLVYVVFNTFYALLTQDEQVRCFRNVAARLAPGAAFVIEAFVPDVARFVRQQSSSVTRIEVDRVMFDVSRHDPVAQIIDSQHLLLRPDGIRMQPVRMRYAWPSELDLMARLAGLRLRSRHAGWRGEPFTAASATHVSTYEPQPS
jgi:SAM-dependent methyltransferase